jgi:hypothetical protein
MSISGTLMSEVSTCDLPDTIQRKEFRFLFHTLNLSTSNPSYE